jgi:hypothetical protein
MKLFHQATKVAILPMLLAGLLVMVNARPILAEKERMGPEVGGAPYDREKQFDPRNGGNTDNRIPPPTLMGREEHQQDHSCGGDNMHHQYPWYVRRVNERTLLCFTPAIIHPILSTHVPSASIQSATLKSTPQSW